jgi:hypothetical protein
LVGNVPAQPNGDELAAGGPAVMSNERTNNTTASAIGLDIMDIHTETYYF